MDTVLNEWPGRWRVALVVAIVLMTVLSAVIATVVLNGDIVRGSGAATGGAVAQSDATTTYRTVVVFRNDDIQPWWRSDERRAVDRVFIDEGVPVTLGVIPVVGGHPISDEDGQELCNYLSDLNTRHPDTFEFALHGYTHEQRTDFQGASEFGGSDYGDQRRWIADGTTIIEDCTGTTPVTFVPPFDSYDDTTVDVLAESGYLVVSGNHDHTAAYFGEREPFTTDGIVHVPNDDDIVSDWSTHEFHPPEEMQDRFDRAYADGSVYVQMIHYFTFTDDHKVAQLRSFIQYMKSHDAVLFTTLGDFGRAYADGRLVPTEDGWAYSPDPSQPGESFPRSRPGTDATLATGRDFRTAGQGK